MRRFSLSLFLFVIFFPINVFGETLISSGILNNSTTWVASNGPYIIQNFSLYIPDGVELTIEAGAEVRFDRGTGMYIEEGANLKVLGEKDKQIVFISNDSSPTAGGYSIYINGNVDIKYAKFKYGDDALYVNRGASTTIDHSTFENNNNGVYVWKGGNVDITNSNFKNNDTGILYDYRVFLIRNIINKFFDSIFNTAYAEESPITNIHLINNSFISNTSFGLKNTVFGYTNETIDARNNYWGSITGPKHSSNPNGIGQPVSAGVFFDPWLTVDPNAEMPACCSSVLFLPGFEASRLYKMSILNQINAENQLWEPNRNADARKLFMNIDGTSIYTDIYTRDVVDEAYISAGGPNIYKSFLNTLASIKSENKIADYSAVPYDWRFSPNDVVKRGVKNGEDISYINETNDPYIIKELSRLASTSQTGKVTIVAHSNGGLITKALMQKLKDENNSLLNKIDKIIFVAVPHLGTPAAIPALLNGYKQDIWLFLNEHTAREFGQNLPGAYTLLPSAKYFTYVDNPVIKSNASLSDWSAKFGETIHSKELLHNFLVDTFERVESSSKDTDNPSYLRESLLSNAESAHEIYDNWIPPTGVEVINIAGWGIPKTLSGVIYTKEKDKIKLNPMWTIDGDGTVVIPSALWTNNNASASRYWVDMKTYNTFINRIQDGQIKPLDHKNILEIPELLNFIKNDLILKTISLIPAYISTSTPITEAGDKRLIYSLHSPLSLDIYDNAGNHTGMSTTTGQIEEQIPGTYFVKFGETKYFFAGSDIPLHIVMTGYDAGTFTFSIEEKQGDNIVSVVIFKDIPTTPTTKVSMFVVGNISTLSPLNIDSDNDGTADIILNPIIGGTVTYEPPIQISQTRSSSSGGSRRRIIQDINETATTSSPIISPVFPKIKSVVKPIISDASDISEETITKVIEIKKTNSQVAQAISANSRINSKIGSLWSRVVSWLVSKFK